MDYINEIHLKEAIVHILDQNSDEPILTEYPLILTEDIDEYLTKHLTKSLKDEELKYGYFKDGRIIVNEASLEYFNGNMNFIDMSKELARKFFAVMKGNGTIGSCDLLIVSFLTDLGPMIGILKLDYIKNYAHVVDFVNDKIGIKIVEQYSGLPAASQKLQKCAFVKSERDTSDLLVIDKINKKEDQEGYASNYFIENYLECTLEKTNRDKTKDFITNAEKWTQKAFKENAESANEVRNTIKRKLREEDSINIENLATEMFQDNEDAKESFNTYLLEKGVKDTIDLDKNYVEKRLKRVRLKIDKDIDIYLSEEAYNDNRRFEIIPNGDGSVNMVIKNVISYIEK
ncbi:nucleoid-associated protein [uncultured Clostridium sp.]|uniref:nucleoid-associated protein n=3 Tax=uncultured Clostridium sp. TaxID=59620 RepID=UPI0025EB56B6|nr:nucleoid-associated protein [uncultured Clostridium sp.]